MSYPSVFGVAALCCLALCEPAVAANAYVRVSQVGYEAGHAPYRAYLMSTSPVNGETYRVIDAKGDCAYSGLVGAQSGTWSHDAKTSFKVYALDFDVPAKLHYSIEVSGTVSAKSPVFAVALANQLYPGLLLNAKFYYESSHDGPNYVQNSLRSAPGHLNDRHAAVYRTPPLDSDDKIATTNKPLDATGKVMDASGGWWDAGDYLKYVETISYALALQEIGVRDFPKQMGTGAPFHPPAPPNAISYAGDTAGAPHSADFSSEALFGVQFLMKMWDDKSKTLYYQVGNSQDWDNFDFLSDYDIWRLPQADDNWNGCTEDSTYICHRPVFQAGPAGSKISPNLAGRLAADFAVCYQNYESSNPTLAAQCLKNAEDIFQLADTSYNDPANSVDGGSCGAGCLLTIIPFDGYPETVWSDDMELGAAELALALQSADNSRRVPTGLLHFDPAYYLKEAARFAHAYVANIYNSGGSDTLNLYDVSGLAHFELYRALRKAGNPQGLAINEAQVRAQLLKQVDDAITRAQADTWGFGDAWNSDTTSHGAGLSVMASEAFYLSGKPKYDLYAQRWMANVMGANVWGSSFIVGDGSATFPNCIQHQVANLAGATNGTEGGTPILWGAASEGPAYSATSGLLDGMNPCPANGVDTFARFNGNSGSYNADATAVYQDNVQSYSTTEPAIDLTASSFLMWSWRIAGRVD